MIDIKCYPNNRDEFVGAETLMKWLHGRTSGVFAADGSAAVSAVQNKMAVTLTDGYGWMSDAESNGVVWWVETYKTTGQLLELGIDPADGVSNRIDRIIVEWTTTNYSEYPVVKVLKGVNGSNPIPPALTNNSTVRQISLARILVKAGTLSISPSDITDERMDASVCGIVTDRVSVDTSMVQAQMESVLKAIQDELANLEAGTAVELKKLQFNDSVVQTSAFVENGTYPDSFPYRAAVALSGVTTSMIPYVTFAVADAISGNFAPVAETYNGGVYIYAANVPEKAITIPTILCWRGNA